MPSFRAKHFEVTHRNYPTDAVVMSSGPLFLRLGVPNGMEDLLEGLAREVLRHQPKDIYKFAAIHFEGLLLQRQATQNVALSGGNTTARTDNQDVGQLEKATEAAANDVSVNNVPPVRPPRSPTSDSGKASATSSPPMTPARSPQTKAVKTKLTTMGEKLPSPILQQAMTKAFTDEPTSPESSGSPINSGATSSEDKIIGRDITSPASTATESKSESSFGVLNIKALASPVKDLISEGSKSISSGLSSAASKAEEMQLEAKKRAESAKSETESKISDLKSEIESKSSEVDSKIEEAKSGLAELSSEAENKVSEAKIGLEKLAADADAKISETKQDVETKAAEIEESALSTLENATSTVESKVKSKVESVISEVENKVEEVKSRAESAAAVIESEIDNSKSEIQRNVDEVQSRAESAVADIESEIEKSKSEIESKVEEVKADIEKKIDDVKSAVENKTSEFVTDGKNIAAQVENKVEEAGSEIESKAAEIKTDAQNIVTGIENQVEETKSEIESKATEIKLEAQNIASELESKAEEIKSQAEKEVDDIKSEAENAISEMGSKIDEVQLEAEKQVDTIKTETETVASNIQSSIEDLKSEAEEKVEEIKSEAETAIADAENKIEESKSEAENIILEVESKVEEAKSDINSKVSVTFSLVDDLKTEAEFKAIEFKDEFEQSASNAEEHLVNLQEQAKNEINEKVNIVENEFTSVIGKAEEFVSQAENEVQRQIGDADAALLEAQAEAKTAVVNNQENIDKFISETSEDINSELASSALNLQQNAEGLGADTESLIKSGEAINAELSEEISKKVNPNGIAAAIEENVAEIKSELTQSADKVLDLVAEKFGSAEEDIESSIKEKESELSLVEKNALEVIENVIAEAESKLEAAAAESLKSVEVTATKIISLNAEVENVESAVLEKVDQVEENVLDVSDKPEEIVEVITESVKKELEDKTSDAVERVSSALSDGATELVSATEKINQELEDSAFIKEAEQAISKLDEIIVEQSGEEEEEIAETSLAAIQSPEQPSTSDEVSTAVLNDDEVIVALEEETTVGAAPEVELISIDEGKTAAKEEESEIPLALSPVSIQSDAIDAEHDLLEPEVDSPKTPKPSLLLPVATIDITPATPLPSPQEEGIFDKISFDADALIESTQNALNNNESSDVKIETLSEDVVIVTADENGQQTILIESAAVLAKQDEEEEPSESQSSAPVGNEGLGAVSSVVIRYSISEGAGAQGEEEDGAEIKDERAEESIVEDDKEIADTLISAVRNSESSPATTDEASEVQATVSEPAEVVSEQTGSSKDAPSLEMDDLKKVAVLVEPIDLSTLKESPDTPEKQQLLQQIQEESSVGTSTKEEEEESDGASGHQELEQAATKIQASFRGYKTRKAMNDKTEVPSAEKNSMPLLKEENNLLIIETTNENENVLPESNLIELPTTDVEDEVHQFSQIDQTQSDTHSHLSDAALALESLDIIPPTTPTENESGSPELVDEQTTPPTTLEVVEPNTSDTIEREELDEEALVPDIGEPLNLEGEVVEVEVAVEPENIESEKIEPEITEKEEIETELIESVGDDPENIKLEGAESESVEPEIIEPKPEGIFHMEIENIDLEVEEKNTVEEEAEKLEIEGAELAEFEAAESTVAVEPETVENEVVEPIAPEKIEEEEEVASGLPDTVDVEAPLTTTSEVDLVKTEIPETTPEPEKEEPTTPTSAIEELFYSSTHVAATPIAFLPDDTAAPLSQEEITAAAAHVSRTQNLSCSSGECADVSASLTEPLAPLLDAEKQPEGEDEVVWTTLQRELSETEAATKIQANFRGHRARQTLLRREDALNETSDAPAAADLRHSGEFHDSLVLLPALSTGLLSVDEAGRTPNTERAEAADEQDDSTTLVSDQDMPNNSSGEMSFLDKAATCIQATFRGFKARSELKTKKKPDPAASKEDHDAAAKIQAGFRGYKVRKEMKERSSNQQQVSPPPNASEEEKSAVKIQAGVRGYLTRQRLKKDKEPPPPPSPEPSDPSPDEINNAVVKIQAGFRGYKARQEVKNIRQNK